MAFQRWESEDEYTHAFRIFNSHHTYMNSLYWSHVPASTFVQATYRKNANSGQTTNQVFNLSGPDSNRVAQSLEDYSKHLKEFDNWVRLNTLVSVLGYFEIYLGSIISLSVESDPGILFSITRKIDGVSVLKHSTSEQYSFYEKSDEITKGEWSTRVANYGKIFGLIPIDLGKNITALDKMRKIRNNVAHAFGRDINLSRARSTWKMLEIERLSEDRLKRYMEIIRKVARGIDAHLLEKHIGSYEMLHFYHTNIKNFDPSKNLFDFKVEINSLNVKNKGITYCKDLVSYYNSI
ncbi:hypothetical protein AB3G33_10655 [Flavobacterium sp. WC2421]|uniref:hypothetical protein n=1 Tax=Flavobacterium sp. WC2421 TaxID=3234138 RepID=UPI003467E6C0